MSAMSMQTSSLNDLSTDDYEDDEYEQDIPVVAEEEEGIDDPFLRMTGSRRQSSNLSFRFTASPLMKLSKVRT